MTWTRVAFYWALFLGLLVYDAATAQRRRPVPPAPAGLARAIELDANEVVAIELNRAGRRREFRRAPGGRWSAVAPDTEVPPDLIAALVAAVTSMQLDEVVANDAGSEAAFGLAPPRGELVLIGRNGRQVKIATGAMNPAGTAVYARAGDDPRVLVIGLDVRAYEDLLFAD